MTAVSFAEFLRTPELSGDEWQKPTRAPWHVLAKAISGEALTRSELRQLRAATGLDRVPRNLRVLVLLIGRRGGKTHFLAAFAVWTALFAQDWRRILSRGERGVVLLLGVDTKQARVLSRYSAGLCESPLIAPEVARQSAEEIEFANGTVIEIGVSDFRTVRSRSCLAVIFDEACFAASEGEGVSPIEEVVAAAEPSMATIPGGGWLLLSSSPYRPKGLLHRRWRELHGKQVAADAAGALCWVAASTTMNPSLPKAYVARKLAEDPVRARCEYVVDPSSPWRSGDADFIPPDAIEACTDWRVTERPPTSGVRYWGFTDAAGGTGQDSFTLGIAHTEPDGRVVLDCVRERKPRFVPSAVVAEFCEALRSYGLTEVHGDGFSGGFVRDDFAREGITYRPSKRTKSEIYLASLPLLLNGSARVLDIERLRTQLASLERRTHAGGRESVDAARGIPEDLANAAMGAVVLAAPRVNQGFVWWVDGAAIDQDGVVRKIEPEPEATAEPEPEAEPVPEILPAFAATWGFR